jgi:cyclic pyranopterin phosphate synthase
VLPAAEMVARIGAAWPLEPVGRAPHGTARRWRYRDGAAEAAGADGGAHLAVVASISEPFCGDCNRLRVTADGVAYTCLFAGSGTDLRPWLRPGPDAAGLEQALRGLWLQRRDRWSEERQEFRSPDTLTPSPRAHAEMAYLGG